MAPNYRRLGVTILLPLLAWAAQRILLPGIETWRLARLSIDRSTLSIVAIGLTPALSGYVLVELIAWLVPRWRSLRIGDPAGRAAIRRAAVLVSVVLAAIQGWFLASFLGGRVLTYLNRADQLLMAVTLVGGTCLLLALSWLIDEYGLGNGFSVLLAAAAVPSALRLGMTVANGLAADVIAAQDVLTLVLEVGAIVLGTHWILTAHRRIQPQLPKPWVALRHPTSGILPLVWAASLLLLPAQLGNLGSKLGVALTLAPGSVPFLIANAVLIVALAIGLSILFNPAGVAEQLRRAIGRTLAFLLGVAAVSAVAARGPLRLSLDVMLVVTATAASDVAPGCEHRGAGRRRDSCAHPSGPSSLFAVLLRSLYPGGHHGSP
jgi:preprotein translocase subunit SecY